MQHHNKSVKIKNFEINNLNPFILIAGPCAIESKDHAFDMASRIKEICLQLKINFIYIIVIINFKSIFYSLSHIHP